MSLGTPWASAKGAGGTETADRSAHLQAAPGGDDAVRIHPYYVIKQHGLQLGAIFFAIGDECLSVVSGDGS